MGQASSLMAVSGWDTGVSALANMASGQSMYQLQRVLGVLEAADKPFRDRLIFKSVKMPGFERKHMLRSTVAKRLPKGLLRAPKKGFVPPLRSWLNEEALAPYSDRSQLAGFGLKYEVFQKYARLNGEGKRDLGHFLWIVLLLLRSDSEFRFAS